MLDLMEFMVEGGSESILNTEAQSKFWVDSVCKMTLKMLIGNFLPITRRRIASGNPK